MTTQPDDDPGWSAYPLWFRIAIGAFLIGGMIIGCSWMMWHAITYCELLLLRALL